MNYKEKLAHIRAVVLDVDGVLTDGTVFLSPDGSMLRSMNVKDGYVMQYAIKKGLLIAAITGGRDEQVANRLSYLGLKDIYLNSSDKLGDLHNFINKYSLSKHEILAMGDDIPDIPLLQNVELSTCPVDAVPEIKAMADYVSPKKGGKGCVRDILVQILKSQKKWEHDVHIKSI